MITVITGNGYTLFVRLEEKEKMPIYVSTDGFFYYEANQIIDACPVPGDNFNGLIFESKAETLSGVSAFKFFGEVLEIRHALSDLKPRRRPLQKMLGIARSFLAPSAKMGRASASQAQYVM